jgi:hypothetical protein
MYWDKGFLLVPNNKAFSSKLLWTDATVDIDISLTMKSLLQFVRMIIFYYNS